MPPRYRRRHTSARNDCGSRPGWRTAAPVANLDPVSHDTTVARRVHGLRSLAALDDDSALVLEESGMEVPAHDPFVEGAFQARQLRS